MSLNIDLPIPSQASVEAYAARQWAYGQERNPEEERVAWENLDEITKFHVKEAVLPSLTSALVVLAPVLLEWSADRLAETDPIETSLGGIDYPVSILRGLAEDIEKALGA